jgi:hypothetical protein
MNIAETRIRGILEAISHIYEEYHQAGELDEAEEIVDVVFPSNNESAVVVHLGEEAFDFPSAAIAAEQSPILRSVFASGSVGEIISTSYRFSCWSSSSESYALSPMSRSGNCSRKHPARTASTR